MYEGEQRPKRASSNQSLKNLPLHHAACENPLDCSLKLADIFAIELRSLVVEGVFGVWFVEQVDKPVDDRIDIQHLHQREWVVDEASKRMSMSDAVDFATIALEKCRHVQANGRYQPKKRQRLVSFH